MFTAQKGICWIRHSTYIFLVEVQNRRNFELGTLLFYFLASERSVMMFFEPFYAI